MNNLEKMKVKAEIMRVEAAKADMEYIVAMREDEIERIMQNIEIQSKKAAELKQLLKE